MIVPSARPSFGERVKRQRRLLDLTQAELAKRASCARVTIHKIESDDLLPSRQLAELLAQVLQVPIVEREAFVQLARGAQAPEVRLTLGLTDTRPLSNLPLQLTSFIGRKREMAEVEHLLDGTRLLTLTGSGGTGKTRLSLAIANDELERFPDGVWLVELASLTDPGLIPYTVASNLGVPEQPGRPILTTLTEQLHDKHLLLILDNCEHLIEACARFSDTLLHAAPKVKILASSREAFGIAGESVYHVPSLSVPGRESAAPNISQAELMKYAAIQLFVERAAAAKFDFLLTGTNAPAVAQICYRLDGIPLAIELAAARIKVFSAEQIAERLADRFRLLTGGNRTALPRQQTLRGAIDWSYSLLSEAERIMLHRLSVFTGGWSVEAVESVCAGEGITVDDAVELLTRLVEKSLVVAAEKDDVSRYRMLETIWQYARDKLLESGEMERLRAHHVKFYVDFAQQFAPEAFSPRIAWWFSRLEEEIGNFRAALDWSLERHDSAMSAQIASPLMQFWQQRHPVEGLSYFQAILAQSDAGWRGRARAEVLQGLGFIEYWQGNYSAAQASYEEALSITNEVGNEQQKAELLVGIGQVSVARKDYVAARSQMTEALRLLAQADPQHFIPVALRNLGDIAMREGNLAEAKVLYEDSLIRLRLIRRVTIIPIALRRLGQIALLRGEIGEATTYIRESLMLNIEHGDRRGIATCLAAWAAKWAADRRTLDAVRLFGAASTALDSWQTKMLPIDQDLTEHSIANLRRQLDAATFHAVESEGRALTLEQAVALALEEPHG